ncbi:hypothetical protein PHYPSEUDO_005762 [Phytophthora pseudosyringae]|uniref:Uncharacterized protein n=1 Tax=Phytophthora pseudosyringae TaxID=221518 RepID=A0A8T1VNM6_9STRA|nr:hypothetical protein PHYPSEUDO_005762 [Phytophthora pseudosyringae]
MSAPNPSGSSGLAALIAATTPAKRISAVDSTKKQGRTFASPSFLSPAPAPTSQKPQHKLTLSGQPARKIKPAKRPLGARQGLSAPSTHRRTPDKKASKLPASGPKDRSLKHKKTAQQIRVLEDISNRRNTDKQRSSGLRKASGASTTLSHDPTRKLEFPTPVKPSKKAAEAEPEPVESSSSSASSSSSSDEEGYSSDEAEVTFDAATIGNMRVVREPLSQSPALSAASSSSTAGMPPLGLEYQFSVSSTVSSVAVAPSGKFLVVGFYNGMVYLYPLTKDSLVFRRGVLLDQIMPRGMYTQIMVTVSIPEDGKFIFAGVYRGSTDIRAFEVDSITLPSPTDLPQSTTSASSVSLLTTGDSDDSDGDEDGAGVFGLPTAKVVSHTYSDAKLKGFAAAKSLYHKGSKKTEYRLLCGIGIKNVHMWRFYQQEAATGSLEWSWECVFDKQTNGISLEFITFHPTIADQFISKSEHQNVRIWHLEETYEASNDSVTIRKKSHTDVKQTVDTVAVYGDYAYGGSESLAVVDLQSTTRMDLDLPLSAKEQRAQREAALNSRNASSLRAWNPRGSRRRGAEDTSAQRHMRTVSKVAGQDASPFTVGMCSDGSVFFHQPKKETGIATPLDYIEGYEQFFVDPSLDFQAQFSDLTRVNTSGLVAVLPLPATEKEKWMVVAANQDQLLVRSLEAFLHRNQQKKEYSQVKSDLRNVMRDLGGAQSSSAESGSSSDSDGEDKSSSKEKHERRKKPDKALHIKRSRQETPSKPQESERKVKRSRHESDKTMSSKASSESGERRKVSPGKNGLQKKSTKPKQLSVADEQDKARHSTAVTTPKRGKLSTSTASPVVSISSSSGSSNPNTPEQPALSRVERQLLALKELQWTPPPATASKTRADSHQEELTESAVDAAAVLAKLGSSSNQAEEGKSKNAPNGKKTTQRMKAQALFTDIVSTEDSAGTETCEVAGKEAAPAAPATKKPVAVKISNKRGRAASKKSPRAEEEQQDVSVSEPATPTEEDNQVEEREEDAELDEELEQLEQYEPEFVSVPLVSDQGSLLAATMYQYADPAAASASDVPMADADDEIAADRAAAASEQTNLLLQFAHQNERLKMNFQNERERLYQHPDCSCGWHSHAKKSSSGSSTGGANWRRNVARDYLKRKQLKRRHKKQLALKLQQLHASYAVQIQELYAMQQLQAGALRARQQFQHLQAQFRGQAGKTDSSFPSSPSTVAAPIIKHGTLPDHLSGAVFPYPALLS